MSDAAAQDPVTAEEEAEEPTMSLDPEESVYTYVLFLPAINRYKYKKVFDSNMCIGILLFMLNFAMQIGLTYIVGSEVLEDGAAWRHTLVGMDVEDQITEGQVSQDASEGVLLGIHQWLHPWHLNPSQQSALDTVDQVLTEDGETDPWSGVWRDKIEHLAGFEQDEHQSDLQAAEMQAALLQTDQSFNQEGSSRARLRKFNKPAAGGGGTGGAAAAGRNGKGGAPAGSATLCRMNNGNYSCLPPSGRFAAYWKDLDANGDGIWSRSEAEKDAAGLMKRLKVKPFQLFRAIAVGLADRPIVDKSLWISPEVANMEAIPKPYFDYWAGDAALCSYADVKMCGTLIQRGFFDAAMDPANAGKGINSLASALNYCNFMLKVGGGCDQSLPQIFKLYRARRHAQCGDGKLYSGGIYDNPHNEADRLYIINVAYSALTGFLKADGNTYKFFVFLVLLIWFLSLISEMQTVLLLSEMVARFPGAGEDGGIEVAEEDGEEKMTITGITSGHRTVLAGLTIMRLVIVIYLGWVGSIFLISETSYMDLLMNAVALAFILDIDEILYSAIAREDTKGDFEATNPIEWPTKLPTEGWSGWMISKDFWGLVIFPIFAIALIAYNSLITVKPVLDALHCACYQVGPQCTDAHMYGKGFWDTYWTQTMPSVVEAIAALKEKGF